MLRCIINNDKLKNVFLQSSVLKKMNLHMRKYKKQDFKLIWTSILQFYLYLFSRTIALSSIVMHSFTRSWLE